VAAAPCIAAGRRIETLAIPEPAMSRSVAASTTASWAKISRPATGEDDGGSPVHSEL
jgi:hypothetical protein